MIKLLKNKFVEIIVTLIIIFNSGYAMSTTTYIGTYMIFILAIIFIFPILEYYKENKVDKVVIALFLLYLMVIFNYIFSGFELTQTYIFYLASITIGFGFFITYDIYTVKKIYLKILMFVSVISLIGYYLINNTSLLSFLPIVSNINDVQYRVGYAFFSILTVPERNCGIFWEPGLFSTFLILAILIETIFKDGKTNWIKVIIFSICIMTTKSAAGYGLLIFAIIAIILNKVSKYSTLSCFFSTVVIIIWTIVMLNYPYIINNTALSNNTVIARFNSEDASANMRTYAVKHNIERFLEAPVLGKGIKDVVQTSTVYEDTSTSTYMLAQFGVFGILYTLYWIIGIMKIKDKNLLTKVSIIIIALLILNKEPHHSILFTWCLMSYLIGYKNGKKEEGLLND